MVNVLKRKRLKIEGNAVLERLGERLEEEAAHVIEGNAVLDVVGKRLEEETAEVIEGNAVSERLGERLIGHGSKLICYWGKRCIGTPGVD